MPDEQCLEIMVRTDILEGLPRKTVIMYEMRVIIPLHC